MNELYTPDGWLDFEYIFSRGAWLNVIIGARQVGKTYGVLKLMLSHDFNHILLRRTKDEVDTLTASPQLSPYAVFEPEYNISFFQSGKITRISDYTSDGAEKIKEEKPRGFLTSLTQIAHVRGFNGSGYSDVVFDEFIPEKAVIIRKTDGDALLNAYTTINGNRELKGERPLRLWLLANTNNINNPVIDSLNLVDDILMMRRKGIEEFKSENDVLIIQPKSRKIIEQRKNTALMRQVSDKSEFYGMAIDNDFSYDRSPYVKTMPVRGLTPLWNYDNTLYCYERNFGFYICRARFTSTARLTYHATKADRERLYKDFIYMVPYYYAGEIAFADLRMLTLFKNIFNID